MLSVGFILANCNSCFAVFHHTSAGFGVRYTRSRVDPSLRSGYSLTLVDSGKLINQMS